MLSALKEYPTSTVDYWIWSCNDGLSHATKIFTHVLKALQCH
jgi:hypothetical protein